MISVAEARAALLALVDPLASETVPLAQSAGVFWQTPSRPGATSRRFRPRPWMAMR